MPEFGFPILYVVTQTVGCLRNYELPFIYFVSLAEMVIWLL